MFKKIFTTGAVAAASLLMVAGGSSAAMAAGPNLVDNGGFEASLAGSDGGKFKPGDNFGGWEMDAGPGNYTIKVWAEELGQPVTDYAAPFTHGTWVGLMGDISQSIPTEAGKTYTLEYDSRASGAGANQWAAGWNGGNGGYASIDGVEVDTFHTVTNPLYSTRTVTFTATSAETVLGFGKTGGGAVGIDNVSVTEVPVNDSPLMVPAIAGGIGMAALAAGGLAFSRKKKSSSK